MKKLHGVVIPLITPFNRKDEVDVPALEALCDFLIDKGVHCLYPCGTTGEVALLTLDERKLIAETVVRKAAQRVTVFVHTGAASYRDTLELTKHAVEIGADGAGIITPWFYRYTDAQLLEYYTSLARQVPGFPIYLYGIPQNAVNDITPALAERICAQAENVVGIKYSFPDMQRLQAFTTVRNGDFSVLIGPDDLFYAALSVGCVGVVSGTAQVVPEYYVAVYDLFKADRRDEALKMQHRANILSSYMHADLSIYKAGLKARGLEGGYMRRPFIDRTPEETAKIKADLEAMNYI